LNIIAGISVSAELSFHFTTFHKWFCKFDLKDLFGGPEVNLKSMSIDKLSKLKDQIEILLRTKIGDKRQTLQTELARLSRFSTSRYAPKGSGSRGPVAPKYRNPENPSETWTGRGLRPRWLVAAMRGGRKLEHFSIAQTAMEVTKKAPTKVRRANTR
jgi:DNA-binding protein H-NS